MLHLGIWSLKLVLSQSGPQVTVSEALNQSSNFQKQGLHLIRLGESIKFIKCQIIPSTRNLGPSDPV